MVEPVTHGDRPAELVGRETEIARMVAARKSNKEIGATLDLSESRVSQMHSSIIMRLKAQMANKDKEFICEEE